MSRMISLAVLVTIIVFTSVLFFRVMAGFFVPLFLAAVLVVIFRPLHEWLLKKFRGKPQVAAGLATAAIFFAVVGPLATVFAFSISEGLSALVEVRETGVQEKLAKLRTHLELDSPYDAQLREASSTLTALENAHERGFVPKDHRAAVEELGLLLKPLAADLPDREGAPSEAYHRLSESLAKLNAMGPESVHYSAQLRQARAEFEHFRHELLGGATRALLKTWANPSTEEIRTLRTWAFERAKPWLISITGESASLLVHMGLGTLIMCVGLYFFFVDGPALLDDLRRLSPLDKSYERELLAEFVSVSRAVVLSTLLSALAQGALAFLGFYFAGLHSVFLLTLLTMLLAMVPIVGASAVWVPACVYLFFVEERVGAAVGLAVYGTLIISLADNFIKPAVLHGQAKLHPLFALLSILGGVTVLGPIGILVGPMIVAFLQALLKILHRELVTFERHVPAASSLHLPADAQSGTPATPPPPAAPPPAPAAS